jgi:hypothetical protein
MNNKDTIPAKEQQKIEGEIVADIHAYIAYSEFNPKPRHWWQKFTACF